MDISLPNLESLLIKENEKDQGDSARNKLFEIMRKLAKSESPPVIPVEVVYAQYGTKTKQLVFLVGIYQRELFYFPKIDSADSVICSLNIGQIYSVTILDKKTNFTF
jgi:hypothetical protein